MYNTERVILCLLQIRSGDQEGLLIRIFVFGGGEVQNDVIKLVDPNWW